MKETIKFKSSLNKCNLWKMDALGLLEVLCDDEGQVGPNEDQLILEGSWESINPSKADEGEYLVTIVVEKLPSAA